MSDFNFSLLEITYRLQKEYIEQNNIGGKYCMKKIKFMLYPPTYGKLDTIYKPLIFIVVHDL